VEDETLLNLLRAAFSKACSQPAEGETLGKLHRARASKWVSALCEAFHEHYQIPDIRTQIRSRGKNRNELLYDIVVCRYDHIPSAQARKKISLPRITHVLWQIESEVLPNNSRGWVDDFNKLVLGSADRKLFVGSFRDSPENMRVLADIAPYIPGLATYLALIPHPASWDKQIIFGSDDVSLWRFTDHGWSIVNSTKEPKMG
jgi:hypothetical protein